MNFQKFIEQEIQIEHELIVETQYLIVLFFFFVIYEEYGNQIKNTFLENSYILEETFFRYEEEIKFTLKSVNESLTFLTEKQKEKINWLITEEEMNLKPVNEIYTDRNGYEHEGNFNAYVYKIIYRNVILKEFCEKYNINKEDFEIFGSPHENIANMACGSIFFKKPVNISRFFKTQFLSVNAIKSLLAGETKEFFEKHHYGVKSFAKFFGVRSIKEKIAT